MKKLIFSIGLLVSFQLNSQILLQRDTVRINEVIIRTKQIGDELPGFKKTVFESSSIEKGALRSVAELLSQYTPVFMKSYGGGGTATPSFRGTGAGHTQVTWNGISINDPMLGQTDFSLIPAGMADEIQVHFGAASMDIGNGGLGGTINLENKTDLEDNTTVRVTPSAGSFGRLSELIVIKTGNGALFSTTKAYFQSLENDFPFKLKSGNDQISVRRTNSNVSQKGLMQEVSMRQKNNLLSARIWYHSASRELPGPMSMVGLNSGERQDDESFRSMITLNNNNSSLKYYLTASWMMTKLDYAYPLYSIISNNISNTLVLKGGVNKYTVNNTRLGLSFNNELNTIKSNNYEKDVLRNTSSVTFSAVRKTEDRIGGEFLIRQTIDGKKLLIPDFSAGIEYRLINSMEQFLLMNISRNSKIPSLNDLNWFPGGNPDLKNEYSWSGEIGYKGSFRISDRIEAGTDCNFFSNFIRDMIQWRPVEGSSFWITDNIRSVNTSGIETNIHAAYKSGELNLSMAAGYAYTKATDRAPGLKERQLIYVPANMLNGSLQIGYKNLYLVSETSYTGQLYTAADNSASLDGYTINNIISGLRLKSGRNIADFSFKVENVFDISYQTIADYPMPGRAFYITMIFQLGD